MPGNPREMITLAERRFPVRIRLGVPPGGLGQRYSEMTAWLDQKCGADGWAVTPSGTRGVLNDAISIYFAGLYQPTRPKNVSSDVHYASQSRKFV
jgi:hypothetical protein